MSFDSLTQSDFIQEAKRLLDAVSAAPRGSEDREHAEHDLRHFLRMNATGRLAEYFATRRGPHA